MVTSRIPATIDALLAACRASTDLTGVQVVDGPPPNWTLLANVDVLYVGGSPDDIGSGAAGEQDFAQLGAQRRDERFLIAVTADCWNGNADMKAARDRAFTLMAAVEKILRGPGGDPSLGGAVLYSDVAGPIDYRPQQMQDGAGVRLVFNVRARTQLA
jgi:hypothetical protein